MLARPGSCFGSRVSDPGLDGFGILLPQDTNAAFLELHGATNITLRDMTGVLRDHHGIDTRGKCDFTYSYGETMQVKNHQEANACVRRK